jgi:hypothetical protein
MDMTIPIAQLLLPVGLPIWQGRSQATSQIGWGLKTALVLGYLVAIAQRFRARTPIQWIVGYMLFSAIGLSVVYLVQSIAFLFTGQLPSIVTRTGHPTSIVFALDLTLLIPFMIVGAIWLLQRKPWGYVLAGISTVKGPMYTLVWIRQQEVKF